MKNTKKRIFESKTSKELKIDTINQIKNITQKKNKPEIQKEIKGR